jgi:hypothetical protein
MSVLQELVRVRWIRQLKHFADLDAQLPVGRAITDLTELRVLPPSSPGSLAHLNSAPALTLPAGRKALPLPHPTLL